MKTHGMPPSSVRAPKRQNGILATPAGSEMKVRMIGSMRVKKTVASPWQLEPAVGPLEVPLLHVQLLAVLLQDVHAPVVAHPVGDPGADEVGRATQPP